MSKAQAIVDTMLESFEKWDKAYGSYKELQAVKTKQHQLYKEMGRAIAYERELARAGLKKADVSHPISGGNVGATHNYKRQVEITRCPKTNSFACRTGGKELPSDTAECPECGTPTVKAKVPVPPSDLRKKYANYIVGVETNDGRFVWFEEPVPPASAF